VSEFGLLALAIGLAFGAPAALTLAVVLLYRRSRRSASADRVVFYHLQVGGSRLLITRRALLHLAVWAIPVIWLTVFLPTYFVLTLVAIPLLVFLRQTAQRSERPLSERSSQLLDNLKDIETQIEQARQHIELMATEIEARQVEVEEKTRMTRTLDEEIDAKLEQYEHWRSMNHEQKQLVIDAARQALSRRSAAQAFSTVLASIILNLVATLIWTLAGSPGRLELISVYNAALDLIR
jgi:TolA-binding protein